MFVLNVYLYRVLYIQFLHSSALIDNVYSSAYIYEHNNVIIMKYITLCYANMFALLCVANIIMLDYMDVMINVSLVGGSTADKCHTPKKEIRLPNENMCDCHNSGNNVMLMQLHYTNVITSHANHYIMLMLHHVMLT